MIKRMIKQKPDNMNPSAFPIKQPYKMSKKEFLINEFYLFYNLMSHSINAVIDVYKNAGTGMFKPVYRTNLFHALQKRGYKVELQKAIPVVYNGIKLDYGFWLDVVVENRLVIHIRTHQESFPSTVSQFHSLLNFSGYKMGLFIDFNVTDIKQGIYKVNYNFADFLSDKWKKKM